MSNFILIIGILDGFLVFGIIWQILKELGSSRVGNILMGSLTVMIPYERYLLVSSNLKLDGFHKNYLSIEMSLVIVRLILLYKVLELIKNKNTRKERELNDQQISTDTFIENCTNLSICSWLWDVGNETIFLDKAAKEIGDEQMFSLKEILDTDQFRLFYKELKEQGKSSRTFPIKTKKGIRYMAASASEITLKGSKVWKGVYVDCTEREELIEELKSREVSYKILNTNLTSFLEVASHDLQEPLRKINYYSGILQTSKDLEEREKAIKRISCLSKMMQTLLDDLNTYNKIQIGSRNRISLQKIIKDLAENFYEVESLDILYEGDIEIEVDSVLIQSLFRNLIDNAKKYQIHKITEVVIEMKENSKEYIISVTDNGIGISEKYWEKVFEPFKRLHTREEYPGTGMGLTICRKIVEQHQGSLVIERSDESGTTFVIRIPRNYQTPQDFPSRR
jgi:signal transduction histidine kinase